MRILESTIRIIFFMYLISSSVFAQWIQTNGANGVEINSICSSGNNLFSGSLSGRIFRSTDNGSNWKRIDTGVIYNVPINTMAATDTNIFAATVIGLFYFNYNDTTWTELTTGLNVPAVTALAINGGKIFVGSPTFGVITSSDNGTKWDRINSGLTDSSITSLITNETDLFAVTMNYKLYILANNNTKWNEINFGLQGAGIECLAVSGNYMFGGTLPGVLVSNDYGATWKFHGFGTSMVTTIAISNNSLFAGTSEGVYLSTDNGNSWVEVNSGLINHPNIQKLFVKDNFIFAGTASGVWERKISEMITDVKEVQNNLPHDFSLAQNYPNPFNPATIINYSIPKASFVTVKVYDVLGRKVATLVNEETKAGNYSINFNASSLASGVYYYRLQAGQFMDTKKLILLK